MTVKKSKPNKYKKNGQDYYKLRRYLGVDRTGKEKIFNRQGFRSSRDAEDAYTKARAELLAGKDPRRAKKMTFNEVARLWWDKEYTKSDIEVSIMRKVETYFNLHIKNADFGQWI